MIEPIHTTGLVTLVSKDDQVDQTTYGRKAKLDLATAAGLPAGTPLSGELLRLLLLPREGGTGTVTSRLRQALLDIQTGEAPDTHNWLHTIC